MNGDADFNGNDIVDIVSITGTTGLTIATNTGGGADNLALTGDDNVNITATTGTLALSGSTGITSNRTITGSVAKASATPALTATPDVTNLTLVEVDSAGATPLTVTNLTGGVKGQVVVVVNVDAGAGTVDFADGGNFELSGARSLTPGDTLTLIFDGTQWLELAVRDNAP
ncbi:MAG: hypothetical protein L6R28_06095 [Planctomycetes bacterium]|nr:hypothetical protein [Planctomycetota bacterium]